LTHSHGQADDCDTGADVAARIGPNAIIRVAEALTARFGSPAAVFADAGLSHYLAAPPQQMVDERDVIALQRALRLRLGLTDARAVSFDAGLRTGDYLLAHRIPRPAQRILRLLPPGPASRMLLGAVGRHAWTFSGSGDFSFSASGVFGGSVRASIAGCPICRGAEAQEPVCDFYTGAFERLFRTLVSRRTEVCEVACQAQGARACVFEMCW
jgi:divinyl protochlorophyllide a 8-vinyl-reductase